MVQASPLSRVYRLTLKKSQLQYNISSIVISMSWNHHHQRSTWNCCYKRKCPFNSDVIIILKGQAQSELLTIFKKGTQLHNTSNSSFAPGNHIYDLRFMGHFDHITCLFLTLLFFQTRNHSNSQELHLQHMHGSTHAFYPGTKLNLYN